MIPVLTVDGREFLFADDVAQVLGVTPGTLANWRSKGIGPVADAHGGRIVYPLIELVQWVHGRADRLKADLSEGSRGPVADQRASTDPHRS